jgi:hypothetical protein
MPNKCRNGEDLIAGGESWIYQQIYDLYPIAAGKMCFADPGQIVYRGTSLGCIPGYIKP